MTGAGSDATAAARRRDASIAMAILAVAAATFAADLRLTLGASVAPFYEIAVLLGLWARGRHAAVWAAGLVSLLILGEALATAPYPWGSTAFNRVTNLLATWSTAAVVVLYKRAEHGARERDREAQAYLDIVAVAIVAVDRDGRVVLCNRTGALMLGAASPVVGRPWLELVVPEQRDEAAAEFARVLSGGIAAGSYCELASLTASGERRTIAWRSACMRDAESRVTGVLSSGEDITERRRAEEAARAQQTLAQVGQMAAVMAHEVRNPLAGIRGAIEVLSERLSPAPPERAVVRAILDRIDGLSEIADELLIFARPRPRGSSRVSLRAVLDEAALLMASSRDQGTVTVEVSGADATVLADARMLKNAFFNLYLNAAQAMGGTGRVQATIEVDGFRRRDEPGAGSTGTASGGEVRVTVADSGPGIPPEWRARIFEAFFTTRHRGTGLGLAIVKRDVEAHGGSVSASCPEGGGTVVTVRLPLAPAEPAPDR